MEDKIEKSGNFRKNFIWNMIGVSLNSFNSLFYMVIITRVNGTDDAGIFTLAFSIACLVFYIGTYSGRVYQVTDSSKSIEDTDYIIQRSVCFLLLLVVSLIYSGINNYSSEKLIVVILLCLVKGSEAFSDVMYGILQKNNQLYYAGYSLTIKSIVSIVLFIIIDLLTHNMIFAIMAMLLTWVLVLFVFDIPKAMKFVQTKFILRINRILFLFRNGFFIFIVNFLAIYIVNAPKYAADGLLSDSSQAMFGIIVMPATLLSVAVQCFIQPYLVQLYRHSNRNDIYSFNKVVFKLVAFIIGIGVVCLIGAYFLGIPVLSLIYGIDLSSFKMCLEIIILSSIFNSISIILSSALVTVNNNFIQFVFYLITSAISLFLCPVLIRSFGIFGATLSFLLILFSQCFLFVCFYVFLNITKRLFIKCNHS